MDPYTVGQFLPPTYDLVWSAIVIAHLALMLTALVLWFRDSRRETAGLVALVAAAVIVFLPVLGPLAYLLSRTGRYPARTTSAD